MPIKFGKKNIITFQDNESLYESIGYIANYRKRGLNISRERFENKWGEEYRIWFEDITNIPSSINNALSAGVGDFVARLNCNEFIEFLIDNCGFNVGDQMNLQTIRATIPQQYLTDFDRGHNL